MNCLTAVSRKSLSLRHCLAAAAFVAVVMPAAANAQDTKVHAVVDGVEITSRDMARAQESFRQALQRVPEAQRQHAVINALVEAQLLSTAAQAAGIEQSPLFKKRMQWMRKQALRDAYVEQNITAKITQDDVKARYDQLIGSQPAETEMHALHILVKTEDEAKAIITELDGGADFAGLAKAKSTGPSGPRGGDLGYFGKGRMVPAFETALQTMKPGEYSATPVKTRFGWHIIKLEEIRDKAKPPFDDVKGRIREAVISERLQAVLKDLRAKSKIELK